MRGKLQGKHRMKGCWWLPMRYFSISCISFPCPAGAEVTAGGVFSDLLRLAAYLGAPS